MQAVRLQGIINDVAAAALEGAASIRMHLLQLIQQVSQRSAVDEPASVCIGTVMCQLLYLAPALHDLLAGGGLAQHGRQMR